ncbi:putative porin [Tamlana agarivorans]|uniref:Porin n=1 Tax=Pseudotamlana agarivorans TaxID=481183 RepID=A0ACC5U4X5_9FLAO|nr:putative porin [Tamlana agarivorans]MBU2949334.1 putative porin [Tamlana agarivorans]
MLIKRPIIYLLLFIFPILIHAQNVHTKTKKLIFAGDFRFRVEQDWDSRKSDGSYRDDRTRLRYRARFGVYYSYNTHISFGARIRTGDPKKQQDPQLTLGDGFKEFGTLPIGFERAYAQFKFNWFTGWVGKNTYPFEKSNELFWSDNVFPEGVTLSGKFNLDNNLVETLQVTTGHFIIKANGRSLNTDSYFEGIQLVTTHWDNRLKFFPAFYYFKNIANIPDGNETFTMDYAITHLGTKVEIVQKPKITVAFDYYKNLKNYSSNDSIAAPFKNQKQGFVAGTSLGQLKAKGDWKFLVTYTHLERFAAIDFMAQNDWARWDYGSQGSPDGRLTNFKGFEVMTGYAFGKNMNLKMRFFSVNQLIAFGSNKETGNRIRLDFNIKF